MSDSSEEEIEKQMGYAKKEVAKVLIPIFALIIIYLIWKTNYTNYYQEEYIKARDLEFHGLVDNKYAEGDYLRAARYIYLDTHIEEYVTKTFFDAISIGDSVYKKRGCDSVFLIIQKSDTMIYDRNEFKRKLYKDYLLEHR